MERATCPKNTESCYGGDPANDRVCVVTHAAIVSTTADYPEALLAKLLFCGITFVSEKITGSHKT